MADIQESNKSRLRREKRSRNAIQASAERIVKAREKIKKQSGEDSVAVLIPDYKAMRSIR